MLGLDPSFEIQRSQFDLDYVAVKAPQFSFDRLRGAEPRLGVEMRSTGEVACFGANREQALLKAMLATGLKIPSRGALLALDSTVEPGSFARQASLLRDVGLRLFATPKTAEALRPYGPVQEVREEDGSAQELLRHGQVDIVFTDPGLVSPHT